MFYSDHVHRKKKGSSTGPAQGILTTEPGNTAMTERPNRTAATLTRPIRRRHLLAGIGCLLIAFGLPLRAQEKRAPIITMQPEDVILGAGSSVWLSAEASGTPVPTLQWFFNGKPLPEGNNTTLPLSDIQADDAGFYWISASNALGQAYSRPALLTVTNTAPRFTLQPKAVGPQHPRPFRPGEFFYFYSGVEGSEPISRQWFHDGVPIPSATNGTLSIESATVSDSGYYSLAVSNAFGTAASEKLWVVVSPVIVIGLGQSAPTNIPPYRDDTTALAAGFDHLLALTANGSVAAWSSVGTGGTNVPPDLSPVLAVAAYGASGLALESSGRVVAWTGQNTGAGSFTKVPANMTSIVAIATSGNAGLAVRRDGSVAAWGTGPAAEVPRGLSNVVAIASGGVHASALKSDGTVVSWGGAPFISVPPDLTNAVAVSATAGHTLALRENGTVASWGSPPSPVPLHATNIVAVAAGAMVDLALRADGRVIAWGQDQGTLIPRIALLSNVVAIASSQRSAFIAAVVSDGAPHITLQPAGQSTGDRPLRLQARAVGEQPMSFQWQRNGSPIRGATNTTLALPGSPGSKIGTYRMVASNTGGSVTSRVVEIDIPYTGSLASALNALGVDWTTLVNGSNQSSSNRWFAQNRETFDGSGSARSGPIGPGEATTLKLSVRGPGSVSFRWKVSSEEGYDRLSFRNPQTGQRLSISGETDWTQITVPVTNNYNFLEWTYAKDTTVSAGQDAGWLDTVELIPGPPSISGPTRVINTLPGRTETLRIGASSMIPLSYAWYRDGAPVPGGVSSQFFSELAITAASVASTHSYTVIASNAAGATVSAPILVQVKDRLQISLPVAVPSEPFRLRLSWPDATAMTYDDANRLKLQASTNLVDWDYFAGSIIVTNGQAEVVDLRQQRPPNLFYRLGP
jgi:hypothetical protein